MSALGDALRVAMDILDPPGNTLGMMASIEQRQRIERLDPEPDVIEVTDDQS